MKKKYYSFEKEGQTATINIYGDITSWAWEELGEVSAYNLSKQLDELTDVSQINVYINSYGGEVAEGLAIYNALRRHKAKVTTYCDGFACSIASVIFMAGDERVMSESSLLMIHNAWTYAGGNAEQLRKQADDLDKITQASVEAYKAHSSLSEEEIKSLMDGETWILPEEALTYGFATTIDRTETKNASQNAFLQLFNIIKAHQEKEDDSDDDSKDNSDEDTDNDSGADNTDDSKDEPDDNSDDEKDDSEEPDNTKDEDDSKDDESEKEKETTAQKWGGFFSAIQTNKK